MQPGFLALSLWYQVRFYVCFIVRHHRIPTAIGGSDIVVRLWLAIKMRCICLQLLHPKFLFKI